MWEKAEHILRSKGGILKVPWSSDKETRLVMSPSKQPHLVKKNLRNKKQYCCDEKCPMLKGFMLCSHVIADLCSFLEYLSQSKFGPNLTVITNCGKPSGSSRKSGAPKLNTRLSLRRHDQSINALKR